MTWTKLHPRRKGELEFHFANEVTSVSDEKLRRAVERHDRRHPHG